MAASEVDGPGPARAQGASAAVPGSAAAEAVSGPRPPLRDRLVDLLLTPEGAGGEGLPLAEFLRDDRTGPALLAWFGMSGLAAAAEGGPARLAEALDRDIARIDALLSAQVDAILHARPFQRLEARWRGVEWLVRAVDPSGPVRVRVLDVSWRELCRDLERAIEFDQSAIFRKVYEDEFGVAGGEPFGLLVGDYEVRHRPGPGHPTDDVAALMAMSHVAAAAFAPFVVGCTPAMLGLDGFVDLTVPIELESTFRSAEYARWRSFRETEDSRFVGIVLPRILIRSPWFDDGGHRHGFRYAEDVSAPDASRHLWGNAAFAFARVVARAFERTGWLADIRGARRDDDGGGLVGDLPALSFETDRPGVAWRYVTDVAVPERRERELTDLGFIALCDARETPWAVFHSNASVHRPKRYDTAAATANARLSALLQYMLCVGRFAHLVKVLFRDKVGSFATPQECERYLRERLYHYCETKITATVEEKARRPLRDADVEVREVPGKPGHYACTCHLEPHFQLDQVRSSFHLEIDAGGRGR